MAGAVITKFEGVYAVMKIYMTEDYRTMSRKAARSEEHTSELQSH